MKMYTEDTGDNGTTNNDASNTPPANKSNTPEPVVSDDHSGEIPKPGRKKEKNPKKN